MRTSWKAGPHLLTCRQVEYTTHLVAKVLAKDRPDGTPSEALQQLCDALVEASIPERFTSTSASYAIDWTGAPGEGLEPPT